MVYRGGNIVNGRLETRNGGYYFTPSKHYASTYTKLEGGQTHAFFLNAKSINKIKGTQLIVRSDGKKVVSRGLFENPWSAEDINIILAGKDAALSEGEYLVNNPNQIKSATDNNGMFSTENNDIQMAISRKRLSINNSLSSQEKSNIRTLLKTINRTGTTLLDNGEGTMYLLDHADKESIENRNPKKEDGFNCRLKFSTEGYTAEDINNIKKEVENGNIQNQKDFNRWAANHSKGQGSNNSDSIDTEDRRTNANNAGLDSEAQQGESRRGQNNPNSQENFGTGFIRVFDNDGTNGPRYIPLDADFKEFFLTPQGEIYGFVGKDNKIYLDERIISPEHPIHEYTHLWDRVVAKRNPKLWKRGIELMKKTSLWE